MVTEPEWDDQQRAWMLALDQFEAECCNRCGGHLPETTKPEHDFNNLFSEAVYAPMPGTPLQCHKCAGLHRSEQNTAALNPLHPQALIHAVHLVPRAPLSPPRG